jgi:transposase
MFAEPVDMRKSYNALSALVHQQMKREVTTGDLYLFVSRNRKRSRVLYFDGTGLCLFSKRLERGHFHAPWKMRRKELSLSELALFIEGSDALMTSLSPPLLRHIDLVPKQEDKDC